MKFTEQQVCAGLSQLFMSLLGQLEAKGALDRTDTIQIFEQAGKALGQYPNDQVNVGASAFVDMLSAQARSKN